MIGDLYTVRLSMLEVYEIDKDEETSGSTCLSTTSSGSGERQKKPRPCFIWKIDGTRVTVLLSQDVHSDRQKRRRIRPETAIKRLKSCRKRRKTGAVFRRFWAVIRHSRLRNGLHRNGKRRRFVPFPLNNG